MLLVSGLTEPIAPTFAIVQSIAQSKFDKPRIYQVLVSCAGADIWASTIMVRVSLVGTNLKRKLYCGA